MSVPRSVQLPPGARPRRLPVAGTQLAAVDAHPSGEPRGTALLVPGYTGSKEDFAPVLGPLTAAGWRVLALDLRGQFESAGSDDPDAYTVEALAVDVRAAVALVEAEAGAPVHLLGHSFGGLVCRRAVLQGAGPASLTLLGSGPGAIGGGRAELLQLMRPVLQQGGVAAVWEASAQLAAAEPGAAPATPEVQDFLRRRFLATHPVGLRAMGDALLGEPDLVDALAAVGLPVLVAHGEGDDAWPPPVQKDMAARLQARYDVVPDALHSPAAEAPEATAALLDDFWGSLG